MHVSSAHISWAGLTSEWCEKTPVISLQLWMFEASRNVWRRLCHTLASGATANAGERIHTRRFGIQATPFFSKTGTDMAVPVVPLLLAL